MSGSAKTVPQLPSPRLRGEGAGRQVRGGATYPMLAPPLIRPFGAPSPRERGEGKSHFAEQSLSRVVDIAAAAEKP